ncbi:hypothetical protein DVH24_029776 [Malus domestica]|uniref:Uncharacterized protein n=1 Tax=Malus domestica TaxID=3750 RepID=A0A498HZK7_MALDO|nr:hypothetical protein DVH24_029776 [Malus domestica]
MTNLSLFVHLLPSNPPNCFTLSLPNLPFQIGRLRPNPMFFSSAPTWKSGSGSISLPLVNLRFNYSFWIFRWNESKVDSNHLDQDHNPLPGTAHLLATSDDELSSNRVVFRIRSTSLTRREMTRCGSCS